MEWRRDEQMEQQYIELRKKVHRKSFVVLIFKALMSFQCIHARNCDKIIARRTAYNLLKMLFSKARWKYSMLDVDVIMTLDRFDNNKKDKQTGYES